MIISLQRYTFFSIYANIFGRKLQIFVNFRSLYGKSNMSKKIILREDPQDDFSLLESAIN